MQQPDVSTKSKGNGKLVVIVMLVVGSAAGFLLSRYMPRRNPKLSDPGSPYYSPPNEDEIKAMDHELKIKRAQELNAQTR